MANDFRMDYGGVSYQDHYDPLGSAVSDSTLATGMSVATDQIVTSDINFSGAEAANFSDYAAGIDATDEQQVSDAMGNLEFNPNGSEQMAEEFMREAFFKIDSFEAQQVQILTDTANAIANIMGIGT